jgi:hypothetical protein
MLLLKASKKTLIIHYTYNSMIYIGIIIEVFFLLFYGQVNKSQFL